MATSFASLSTALTWGSVILAAIALIAGFAWGKLIVAAAEKEAKIEAKRCADAYIGAWLKDEAPAIIRRHVEYLQDATVGDGDDTKAADEIGKVA